MLWWSFVVLAEEKVKKEGNKEKKKVIRVDYKLVGTHIEAKLYSIDTLGSSSFLGHLMMLVQNFDKFKAILEGHTDLFSFEKKEIR